MQIKETCSEKSNSLNIKYLYIHEIFLSVAYSLRIVILPLYIYLQYRSLSLVFLWFCLTRLIVLILFVPVFNFCITRCNPVCGMYLGIVSYLLSFAVFSISETITPQVFLVSSLFFALYLATYWFIRHWVISQVTSKGSVGKDIGKFSLIKLIVKAASPFLFAYISYYFSFQSAFSVASIAILLSLVPLSYIKIQDSVRPKIDLKLVGQMLKSRTLRVFRASYISEGVTEVCLETGWLLAFALFIGNVFDLGLLVTATTLCTALILMVIANRFDLGDKKLLLRRTTLLQASSGVVLGMSFFVPWIFFIWCIDLVGRIAQSSQKLVTESYLYLICFSECPVQVNLNREIFLNIGRFVSTLLLSVVFLYVPEDCIWLVVGIGAISSLCWLQVVRNYPN